MIPSIVILLILFPCDFVPALILNKQEPKLFKDPVKVLVFGDSWGSLGPSYLMLRQMFDAHNVKHEVHSTAVAGTSACHWARHKNNLASACQLRFGLAGPDFIWLSTGGNDLLYPDYLACSRDSANYNEAQICALKEADTSRNCNKIILDYLFTKYPNVQVVQCGYDFQCASGKCVPFNRWPYCQKDAFCANHLGVRWGHRLIEPLMKVYGTQRYQGIFIEGACQVAGKIENVTVNRPNFSQESPCNMMFGCVHPIPGTAAAIRIGEAFWNKYFSKRIIAPPQAQFILPTPIEPKPGWDTQTDFDIEDTICNMNWYPNLADPNMSPPPCNRTYLDFVQ